jgi:hypothetical protein
MFWNWAEEETTTTGTGTLTLTAVTGKPRIADVVPTSEQVCYAILDSTGLPIEAGIGTAGASNTLARTFVRNTYSGGTFTGANATAVSLAAGTKKVIATAVAGSFWGTVPAVNSAASSRVIFSPHHSISAGDTRAMGTSNVMVYVPFLLTAACDISGLCCNVTTGAAGNLRMGLYTVGTDGKPSTKIVETGDVDCTTTGVKTGSITRRYLPSCWYYMAVATKGVNASIRTNTAGGTTNINQQTPLGMSGYDYAYAFATETLSGGWTSLPSTTGTLSYLSVGSDYAPRLGLSPA